MSLELPRTYIPFSEWQKKSVQREYTEETPLLNPDGTLNAKGWARKNVFTYDRSLVKHSLLSRKEWDFYTVTDGKVQLLISFANIGIGGYVGAKLTDLETGKIICDAVSYFIGGNTFIPPSKGDIPGRFSNNIGKAYFDFFTKKNTRQLYFKKPHKGKTVECKIEMAIPEGHENLTTVLPFKDDNTKFFMTTKQSCMPTNGFFRFGDFIYNFNEDTAFCVMDWGRVNTPHEMVWYWGNASTYLMDEDNNKHLFSFEITWAIGDESEATETCIFYDGKVHKFGAVDVEKFPKGRFLEEWKFISEDGRFNLTLTPTLDNHSDVDFKVGRMNCHQIYGYYNGNVTLDNGKTLDIEDLFGFCEYVENKW